jgi:predicted O-linked N-acetylglucosamine transferase (SPINDLY family)
MSNIIEQLVDTRDAYLRKALELEQKNILLEQDIAALRDERQRLMRYWFDDANPIETEYAIAYHAEMSFNHQNVGEEA